MKRFKNTVPFSGAWRLINLKRNACAIFCAAKNEKMLRDSRLVNYSQNSASQDVLINCDSEPICDTHTSYTIVCMASGDGQEFANSRAAPKHTGHIRKHQIGSERRPKLTNQSPTVKSIQ